MSLQLPPPRHAADRREPRHRACHRQAVLRRRLAGDHLLAPCLPGKLPLGDGAGGPSPGRSRRRRRHAAGDRRGQGPARGRGRRLHALVNNAGISPKGEGGARLAAIDTRYEDWLHVFQVNFFASIMLARGLVDELTAAKGSIVNVTSIAGSRVHPFAGAAYATSKAALAALTREMAADFGPLGVRVNAISPGEIDTAILSPGTEKIVEQIPHAPPRHAGRGRQGDLLPVHRRLVLRDRRGAAHQWRAARLSRRRDIGEATPPSGRATRPVPRAPRSRCSATAGCCSRRAAGRRWRAVLAAGRRRRARRDARRGGACGNSREEVGVEAELIGFVGAGRGD